MPDEYLLRLEASGEVTPAQPDEDGAARAYAQALNTPPSTEAAQYMRDRLAARSRHKATPEPGTEEEQ